MKNLLNILYNIPTDKYLHFIVGMLISIFTAFLIPTGMYWCVLPAFIVGLLKEIYDKQDYGLFDNKDLCVTTAGGFVVNIFSILYILIYV